MKYLYGLAVQGIQNYIFDTNALKEIIGASEIIEEISTSILKEILKTHYNENNLLLAAAGNIRYFFDKKEEAQVVYEQFPDKVRELAGNIGFSQAIIEVSQTSLEQTHFIALEKKLRENRNNPITVPDLITMTRAMNRRTGSVQYKYNKLKKESLDYSSYQKVQHHEAHLLLDKVDPDSKWNFPKEVSDITQNESKNYVAVVHADGNQLGKIIQKVLESGNSATVLKKMSELIEFSTIEAFKTAFEKIIVKKQKYDRIENDDGTITNKVPLRPVILGGDDITFIIRADLAVEFTNEYLKAFESATQKNFSEIGLQSGLTATAGVVFIKEKYPFHYGVHLAESICAYAKNKSNRAYSCMQFYKIKDSFVNDYNDIVENELTIKGYFSSENGSSKAVDFKFRREPYKTDEVSKLLEKVKFMKNEEVSIGAFHELLSIMYKSKDRADFRFLRLEKNQSDYFNKKGFSDIIQNQKELYDLISLESLSTLN